MTVHAAWFENGLKEFANGNIDFVNDDIREILIDFSDWGAAITAATNASPIVITSNAHGLSNGDLVFISGVLGNTAANGTFKVANVTSNTFELTAWQDDGVAEGTNIAGNGAYASGGHWVKLNGTDEENLDDIPAGARVSTTALASKTVAGYGVLNAADTTHTSVSGDPVEVAVHYKHTGIESTSTLLYISELNPSLAPDGNNIDISYPAAGIATI